MELWQLGPLRRLHRHLQGLREGLVLVLLAGHLGGSRVEGRDRLLELLELAGLELGLRVLVH